MLLNFVYANYTYVLYLLQLYIYVLYTIIKYYFKIEESCLENNKYSTRIYSHIQQYTNSLCRKPTLSLVNVIDKCYEQFSFIKQISYDVNKLTIKAYSTYS